MKAETFFALVAGAAIGLAAGILIAPDKGSETRRKIKDSVQDGDELKEKAREGILNQLKNLENALTKDEVTEEPESETV